MDMLGFARFSSLVSLWRTHGVHAHDGGGRAPGLPRDPLRPARGDEPRGQGGSALDRDDRRQDPRGAHASTSTDEKRIKAVTVCFTDLEGRLHMLDYDKKFLLKSADNLTFDGSSIRGFSQQARVRPAPGDRLAGVLLAAVRRLRPRQGAGVRRGARARRHRRTSPTCARRLKALHRRAVREGRHRRATPPTRSRASSSRAATPSATTTRPASFEFISHRRLLPLAAGRRAAHVHRHAPPRCSARWASRTRRTTPRWRRRSSR